eukprot:SAG31_NODE_336_length_17493_cov_20.694032_1_plen_154_part_00
MDRVALPTLCRIGSAAAPPDAHAGACTHLAAAIVHPRATAAPQQAAAPAAATSTVDLMRWAAFPAATRPNWPAFRSIGRGRGADAEPRRARAPPTWPCTHGGSAIRRRGAFFEIQRYSKFDSDRPSTFSQRAMRARECDGNGRYGKTLLKSER